MRSNRKRASGTDALFYLSTGCWLLFTPIVHASISQCQADRTDETVHIRHIHDGDTVWLTDGRKIRIIGINTPELARDENPAEPLAEQARDELRQQLGQMAQVRLRFGKEKTDRYGRQLAHLFDSRGQNISEWLLRRGLAYALTVPPNLWQLECYQRAEQQARQQQKGLWSKRHSRLLHADKLPISTRGFQVIRGRVQRIGHSRSAVWVNFNRHFALRVVRKDLDYFTGTDFEKLKGKQLEVRGWVQYHKQQLRMRIRHPAAMRILP